MTDLTRTDLQTQVVAAPPLRRPRRRTNTWWKSLLKHTALIALSLLMIYPLIWMVISSLKPNHMIFSDLSIFTTELSLEHYIHGWDAQVLPFHYFLINSTILVVGAILGNLLSCALAAYAFALSRSARRGRPLRRGDLVGDCADRGEGGSCIVDRAVLGLQVEPAAVDGEGQAHALHDGQVRVVVSHAGDLAGLKILLGNDLLQSLPLVFTALTQQLYAQSAGAECNRLALTPSDNGDLHA